MVCVREELKGVKGKGRGEEGSGDKNRKVEILSLKIG